MGGPLDFLMGGQDAMQGQQSGPVVAPWATKNQGRPDIIAQLLAKEEERQKAEKGKALKLLGVGVMLGKAMGNGQGTMDNGKPGSGAKSAPSSRGGAAPLEGGTRGGGGGSRRDRGAQASKVQGLGPENAKFLPALAAVPALTGALTSGTVAAGGAAGGAAAGTGMLSSPLAGAALAGGMDLAGGMMAGGDQEEMAKRQMRQQGQQNLGQGIRSMSEMLRSRNVEMRSVLANLGR